jgi:hypothetical protein
MSQQRSTVFLLDAKTGREVNAEFIDGITDAHLNQVEQEWQPARVDGLKRLRNRGGPPQSWPQSNHWNWNSKVNAIRGILAYRGFCIVCENQVQGLMLVIITQTCQLQSQSGLPLVYIDYLESAPWNQSGFTDTPRFKGIGIGMVFGALQLSLQEGFHGRLGLHSLPQAETFYERIGMESLGPDASKQNLMYFEMTPEKATAFLSRRSQP